MSNLIDVLGDYPKFLHQVLGDIDEAGFNLNDFSQLDHLCYRTVSQQNYNDKKLQMDQLADLIGETRVNGRMIAVFRLHKPIYHDKWRIDLVEIPAPKAGSDYVEGLEHIEFVLFDEMQAFLLKHSDKQFDLKSVERGINPEAGFRLKAYTVKFHLLSLSTAVYLEKKLGIAEIVS